MKTRKLIVIAALVCLLLGASDIATAAEVILEGDNVIRIENLSVTNQLEEVIVYNVDFVFSSGIEVYGENFLFDFTQEEDASLARQAVKDALNANVPTPTAAGHSGTDLFFIGVEYDDSSAIPVVAALGAEHLPPGQWDNCDTDCGPFGTAVLQFDENFTYADFTVVGTGNLPPTADADGPYTGFVDEAVSFDGSGSSDPEGSIDSYDWIFGDGGTGTGQNPTHTYAVAGNYIVILQVTDNEAVTDADFSTVDIQDLQQPQCGDPGFPFPEGDLDFNCYVDLADFLIMAANWLTCTDPNPPCNFIP
jgi:hypothetical protein